MHTIGSSKTKNGQLQISGWCISKNVDKEEFTLVPEASLYHLVDKQCGFWPHQQIEQESPLRPHRNKCSCKRGWLMDNDSVTSTQSEMLSVKHKAVLVNSILTSYQTRYYIMWTRTRAVFNWVSLNQNQSNHSSQSQRTQIIKWTNQNTK